MASPKDINRIKQFADWLSANMITAGFSSQRQLHIASGVSTATISRILNLKQLPDDEIVIKLANALNKPVQEVMAAAGYPVGTSYEESETAKKTHKKKPKDLLKILEQEDYTLNGELASPEDKEKIAKMIEVMYWDAKEKNKRKK